MTHELVGCYVLFMSHYSVLLWEGSTTVVYTVIWRNIIPWFDDHGEIRRCDWRKIPKAWKLKLSIYKIRVSRPITAPYFPMIVKPRNFAKRQC